MKSDPLTPGNGSRRTFIKTTATAAAAVPASSLLKSSVFGQNQAPSANVLGANERIVCGYIGTGSQGMRHIKLQKNHASENNITQAAVCDLYEKRLKQAQKEAGLEDKDAYDDYRRLLERKDIDAVTVSTVDVWHAPVAIDAMNAGKHVFVEKPMTRYLGEAFDLYDAVVRTGKTFQLGSQGCGDPKYHQAHQWVKEGLVGPLVWAQASYCRNNYPRSEWTYPIDEDANESNLNWKMWLGQVPNIPFTPEHYFSWHKFYAYNSGILGNLLPHRFTPLMKVMAELEFPRRVVCTGTRAISTDREITDSTYVLAEFPSGLTMVVTGSTVNEQGLPDTIRGHRGTLYFASSQNRVELRPERPFADEIDSEVFSVGEKVDDIPRLEKNWFDCIRSGEKTVANEELAIRSHAVLCLAEMAERTNQALMFDGERREIRLGDGKVVAPISYTSGTPVRKPQETAWSAAV